MTDYYVTTAGSDANDGLSEGNAFASPGRAGAAATASGDNIFLKDGTYTLTSATPNANGGPVSLSAGVIAEGYLTTPGDRAAVPVVNAGSISGITMFDLGGTSFNVRRTGVRNIEANGNSQTGNNGFNLADNYSLFTIETIARNCPGDGYTGLINSAPTQSAAVNCGIGFRDCGFAWGCVAHLCGTGFTRGRSYNRCLALACTGHGFDIQTVVSATINECVSWNNAGDGFRFNYDIATAASCIATENGGYGYLLGTGAANPIAVSCASWNNGTGRNNATWENDIDAIILSGDPFTNTATLDFSLADNSAGDACRDRMLAYQEIPTIGYWDSGVGAEGAGGGPGGPAGYARRLHGVIGHR